MNGIYQEIAIVIHQVWRRRWLALAVAAGICVLGWLIVALIPNKYQSTAHIYVEMQSILPNKIGISEGERQKDIDSVSQTLASNANLEKVVRGTDLARQVTSDADMTRMIAGLSKAISVKAQQDNLFEISATASGNGLSDSENAKLSAAIVQRLIGIFMQENLSGNRAETSQTIAFLDDELAKRGAALQAAEQRKADFEQKYMGLLPGVGSISQRMEQARSELSNVSSDLMAAQSSLAAMNGQMAGTPATVAAPNYGGGGAVGGARGRIAALQGQLADAQAKGWTDQHPDVIATRAQIARLAPDAAREGKSGGGGAGSVANPMYMTLRSMQAEKQATAAALAARKAQLQSDMAQFAAKQTQEPEVAAEQSRLNRDYDVLKQQYDKLLGDREDVKLRSDVSARTDTVKFSVIDAPRVPRLPVAPNRLLLLALVLVIGIGGGIAAAFGKSYLRPTYATADRLAVASGLPVLGAVSEIVTLPQKSERHRELMIFAGAGGALAGCFLLLMLVEFVQRSMV